MIARFALTCRAAAIPSSFSAISAGREMLRLIASAPTRVVLMAPEYTNAHQRRIRLHLARYIAAHRIANAELRPADTESQVVREKPLAQEGLPFRGRVRFVDVFPARPQVTMTTALRFYFPAPFPTSGRGSATKPLRFGILTFGRVRASIV